MELEPAKKSLHAGIEALVADLGEWTQLVDLYEAHAPAISDDELRLVITEKAALAAREQLFEPLRAESLYRRILDDDATRALPPTAPIVMVLPTVGGNGAGIL